MAKEKGVQFGPPKMDNPENAQKFYQKYYRKKFSKQRKWVFPGRLLYVGKGIFC